MGGEAENVYHFWGNHLEGFDVVLLVGGERLVFLKLADGLHFHWREGRRRGGEGWGGKGRGKDEIILELLWRVRFLLEDFLVGTMVKSVLKKIR